MRAVPVEHKIGRIAEGGRGDALPGRSNLLVAPAKPGDGCLDEVQKVRLLAARGLRGEGGDQLTRGALFRRRPSIPFGRRLSQERA